MADPHFTVERVLEKFGTREALIDFLLDTEDIGNPKKKLINIFVRFRMVYNAVLPKSTSRLQNIVSKDASKAWNEEKVQHAVFWDDLDRDFLAEHRARFPYYWYIHSLPPAKRKALLDTMPDPKTRSKERSDGDAERKQTPRDRAAPYTVPGSSSSSRFSSSRLSSSRGSRSARSSESYSLPNTSQASSSAGPTFPTPPAIPVHSSTYPSTPAVYPYPHPLIPMYPSIQPHAMIHSDGYMGWQPPSVAYPPHSPMEAPPSIAASTWLSLRRTLYPHPRLTLSLSTCRCRCRTTPPGPMQPPNWPSPIYSRSPSPPPTQLASGRLVLMRLYRPLPTITSPPPR